MSAWFSSGRVIDLILFIVCLEAIVLLVRRSRHGGGLPAVDLFGQLFSGVLLLLAVRCALTGAGPVWTGLFLTASFPAHLFDLIRRTRGRL